MRAVSTKNGYIDIGEEPVSVRFELLARMWFTDRTRSTSMQVRVAK